MTNEITENVKDFILGGKADFTIFQEKTANTKAVQMKYRVTTPKNCNGKPNAWYVSTELTDISDDVTTDGNKLIYQGYLKRDMTFNVGEKGVQNFNKAAINGLLWVLNNSEKLPKAVHIYHHGKCSVCGKKLTDAKSLVCGIGPTCRKRVHY